MIYSFSNKNIHCRDIVQVICSSKQLKNFRILKFFGSYKIADINIIGIKIIKVFDSYCIGYIVHHNEKGNISPYYINRKKILITITPNNNIAIKKYKVNDKK